MKLRQQSGDELAKSLNQITEGEKFEFDVFLSYSSKDKNTVHALANRLKRDGLRIWLDAWEIQPGDSIPLKIQQGLEKSHTLLMCMSSVYFESDWGKLEHLTLLFRDPTNLHHRLIPLLIANCTPPDIIAHFKYVDWRTPSDEEYNKLLASCLKKNLESSSINLNSSVQLFNPRYHLDNKKDENQFKREKAGKINEEVVKPFLELANKVKLCFENEDNIEFEPNSVKVKLNFDGYEFIRFCEKSEIFSLKNGNLNLVYNRDEILNNSVQQIIEYLNNYHKDLLSLKNVVENFKSSNVPTSFENNIVVLLTNIRKHQLAADKKKEEWLFKLYVTVITGKKSLNGHSWAVDLNKYNSKEVLDMIKTDSYSKEIFTRIESLKKEIVSDINELINELKNLRGQWQNNYYI